MTVSVIVPTIGRPTVRRAVESALDQTCPPDEVIVVIADDDRVALDMPDHPAIRLVTVPERIGASASRQVGVRAARGDIVALLDDDDLWHPYKLERQVAEGLATGSDRWIVACRAAVRGVGRREKVWPRTVIGPAQPVADYLFRRSTLFFGDGMLQSSTLCFPRNVALEVPLDSVGDAVHDEPTWLMTLQGKFDDLVIRQIAECYTIYTVTSDSVSRSFDDRTADYIDWGDTYLGSSSARTRGDYFLTSAVTAAASAHSASGVVSAIGHGMTHGRPGPMAYLYAMAKLAVVVAPMGRRVG
ncbi:glycosyltransferase family A protein [Rhodococcus sp. SORGH_AS_0301]|uniref:glycosyltransferase family 2 protein n=1 Tax=Rhodococcus sp. SORGH_AS_0301 TaxID=3041780 RepID=UPI00277DAA80|nr:glycosyltransferase family A protein [Rhodococcus sp. SORGH_AS_0301]MDQ1181968.1 glycosyltransferase involved in cell wall biosynthesis [Rhodococcus sp. SORGH_AS_0301]